jgi:mRNA-degrading endonuclease RelE of RelBE toxin-antitoxin system
MRFLPTVDFNKAAKRLSKKYPTIFNDLDKLFEDLTKNPFQGDPLGDNSYKVRMAITSKGKGKSGGARVITCVKIINDTIHLLTMYDKSEIENISDEYLNELRNSIE